MAASSRRLWWTGMRNIGLAVVAAAATGAGATVFSVPPPGVDLLARAHVAARSRSAAADDAPAGTIVFESDRAGRPAIYVIDVATRKVTHVSGSPAWTEQAPRWSPDGRRIAFASNRAHYEGPHPEPGAPDVDLYVMNADGTGRRRITSSRANDVDAAWAPDGLSLFYSSDAGSRGDLYRVWLADGRIERLTRQFVGRAIMPAVSPDGARVAFAAQTLRLGPFWAFQVHVLDVARGTSEALAASSGACWPRWSHDGRRLANVRLVDGRPSSLEVRDLATGATTRVVDDDVAWSYYPSWSPDDRFLVFSTSPAHHEGEDWDLAIYDFASRAITRLTRGPGNDRHPGWKP